VTAETPGKGTPGLACCRLAPFHTSTMDGRLRRYPSDTTDALWAVTGPLLPDLAWLAGHGSFKIVLGFPNSRHVLDPGRARTDGRRMSQRRPSVAPSRER
jgi:hypothetical protein